MATQERFVSLKLKSLLRLGSLGGFIPWLNIMLARSFCQNEQCHLLRFLCFGKDFADAIGHLNKINFRVKSESFRLSLILFPHPHILQNAFFIYFFSPVDFRKNPLEIASAWIVWLFHSFWLTGEVLRQQKKNGCFWGLHCYWKLIWSTTKKQHSPLC